MLMKMLLQIAFALPETRIVGGPDWLNSIKFAIEAKADSSVDDRLRALSWPPGDGAQAPPSVSSAISPAADSGPSIFTAIQEQFGLKLESGIGYSARGSSAGVGSQPFLLSRSVRTPQRTRVISGS